MSKRGEEYACNTVSDWPALELNYKLFGQYEGTIITRPGPPKSKRNVKYKFGDRRCLNHTQSQQEGFQKDVRLIKIYKYILTDFADFLLTLANINDLIDQ